MPDARTPEPVIPVTLTRYAPLAEQAPNDAGLADAVGEEISSMMAELGIPGRPAVRITAAGPADAPGPCPLALRVGDTPCRFPDTLLAALRTEAGEAPPDPHANRRGDETALPGTPAWWRRAVRTILMARPAILFGPEGFAHFQSRLAGHGSGVPAAPADRLYPALCRVLNLWIAIGDPSRLAHVTGTAAEDSGEMPNPPLLAERIAAALKPDRLEIRLHPADLRRITLAPGEQGRTIMTALRDNLFYDLGMRCPDFAFVPDTALAPGTGAFRINHLILPAIRLLSPEERLIDASPSDLASHGITAHPIAHPAGGKIRAKIHAPVPESVAQAGYTVWGAMGYLGLHLSAVLRRHGYRLIHQDGVARELERLAAAYPELVRLVRHAVPPEPLTGALRLLASEGISIRNLRAILERLLDFDTIVTQPRERIVFDDRLAFTRPPGPEAGRGPVNLAAFIRTGMKNEISYKYTQGQSTLVAYLLDPEIEGHLEAARERWEPPPPEISRRFLRAMRQSLADLPAGARPPCLLTADHIRFQAREQIGVELPHIPVLAYQEMSPLINIQPVARITLS